MRTVCLKHVPFEGPGAFAAHLVRRGVVCERHLVPTDGLPSNPGDLLLVMGGPMSVNDPDPWIGDEIAFIRSAMEAGTSVLGICLGSQLMAKALGATVRSGTAPEIGMTPVHLMPEGRRDPVFRTFRDTFDVFQWHGEVFDLPSGSVALARSESAPVQAFRYGSHAYGLLFHLEIDRTGVEALCRECAPDIDRAQSTAHLIQTTAVPHFSALHEMAGRLLDHLLPPD